MELSFLGFTMKLNQKHKIINGRFKQKTFSYCKRSFGF